jgi:AcrR family transcriptional regulator
MENTTPPPPTSARRADAQHNYDRILAAARQMFREKGAEASLEGIARHAGVGIGTLYRHFPTRHALIEAIFGEWLHELQEHGDQLCNTATPDRALREWLRMLLATSITFHGMKGTLLIDGDRVSSRLRQSQRAMRDSGDILLKNAQRAGAIRHDITIDELLELIHTLGLSFQSSTSQTDRLLTLLLEGITSRPAT